MFFKGDIVEIQDEQFEFWFKNEPSGHYAIGEIIEDNYNRTYEIRLFCNDRIYTVHEDILVKTY